MLIACLVIVALAYGVYSAVIQMATQLEAYGRVPMWDWVAYAFLLGWLLDLSTGLKVIVARIDAFTLWLRVNWQSVGEPLPSTAEGRVWVHGASGDLDDFRDWLERSGSGN